MEESYLKAMNALITSLYDCMAELFTKHVA